MSIIEKQWELQSKKFPFLDKDLVEKIKDTYILLERNNFTGVFKLEDDVYHHGIGIAKGKLDQFRKSPLKYYHNHCVVNTETPDAFKIGGMVHELILEPEKLKTKYCSDREIIMSLTMLSNAKNPRLTKEYKDYVSRVEIEGKIVLKDDDYKMCKNMANAVLTHEKLQNILRNGLAERSVFSIDPETGLVMRCKPDFMIISEGINFDAKTTADASLAEFQKSILNYNYHVQGAYYNYVCTLATKTEFNNFLFGCIEKEEPHDIALYYLDEAAMEKGEQIMRLDLNNYANAVETNKFPGYSRDIEAISIPHWGF